jgi:hypothetical protein
VCVCLWCGICMVCVCADIQVYVCEILTLLDWIIQKILEYNGHFKIGSM